MNFKLPSLFLILLFALGCKKENSEKIEGIPECVFEEIEENKKTREENNYDYTIRVLQYDFKGDKVFYVEGINTIIADLDTKIYDESCEVVCLVGGWNTIKGCNDFYQEAENETVVWTE